MAGKKSPQAKTPSEEYLGRLCDRSFLKLWSFANPYRDQGPNGELCDLLVVFGNDIVVFSDKSCRFGTSGDLTTDWSRWYRKAIVKSASQIYGAERWLLNHPDRVFLDNTCSTKFPWPLPCPEVSRVHRVIIALGAKEKCRKELGGSGSLLLFPHTGNASHKDYPFAVGDLDPSKGFVHVFDEVSLDLVLAELDTISDFISYLTRKESLIRADRLMAAESEEDLLAWYLRNRADEEDPSGFGIKDTDAKLVIDGGHWNTVQDDPQFKARKAADRISYLWDQIIDDFARHALAGTLIPTSRPLTESERLLRQLASEPRFQRRLLSEALFDLVAKAPTDSLVRRSVLSEAHAGTAYVFLSLPRDQAPDEETYRRARQSHLHDYCYVLAWKFRDRFARVIGIATEPNARAHMRSHDLVMVEVDEWTDDLIAEAQAVQQERDILWDHKLKLRHLRAHEYPKMEPLQRPQKIKRLKTNKLGRNDPCPCGSGRKFKRCCGSKH